MIKKMGEKVLQTINHMYVHKIIFFFILKFDKVCLLGCLDDLNVPNLTKLLYD